MDTKKQNTFGNHLKWFLVMDFFILLLSLIGTAQLAGEAYRFLSFGGFAALFQLVFGLFYCGLSVAVLVVLGVALWRRNAILATIVFVMQIMIRLPSCFFYLLDGYGLCSWHEMVIWIQIAMGIVGLFGLIVREFHRKNKRN